MIDLRHGLGFCYLCICHVVICRVSALLSTLIRVCKYWYQFSYGIIDLWIIVMKFESCYDIRRILSFMSLTCHIIWNLLLTYHTIEMTIQALVVPMLQFLLISPFWDVSTVKRLTSNNQDIQARSLVLTIIVCTRLWIIIFHMYEYCVIWHLQVYFSCPNRIGVDSFSWLMDLRRLIHIFFFSRMIGMILLRCAILSIGFLHHQIHCQWQIKRRAKQVPDVSANHLRVNVAIVLSWWTRLSGWITHHFFVARFL
jgi:hypothetical protein